MKAWLRSPDDRHDGIMGTIQPEESVIEHDGKRFIRHDVKCGTANWIEFWEEGYTPPGREEQPTKGRKRGA